MRTSQTFIVRLLADLDEPEALRGLIHSVASGEERPFADGTALLVLLRRMANAVPQTTPREPNTREEEKQ